MADKPRRASEYYVVRNFGSGVEDVASCLRPLLADEEARRALEILRDDFLDHDGSGPRRVAEFLHGGPDDDTQADVVGFIGRLIANIERPTPPRRSR